MGNVVTSPIGMKTVIRIILENAVMRSLHSRVTVDTNLHIFRHFTPTHLLAHLLNISHLFLKDNYTYKYTFISNVSNVECEEFYTKIALKLKILKSIDLFQNENSL